ncbi:MAG: aminoacyl-tRNA hydrolase [Armatimonadetes bacterium CG07_land_8_20_14_0_80_40_9]|nr:MAG: aminoacyl-tRNA hydrolase [Armatimonadetes bacterium CG07_land_8_20_14_0_80_40_9]
MKLVVGLGNPGRLYRDTRHNLGFKVVDKLSKKFALKIKKRRFGAKFGEVRIKKEKIILVKPLTFINLSGEAVSHFCRYFKLKPSSLLVICDDLNLSLGKLRIRSNGSAGGHKGLHSIIEKLGTKDFARLRIGIGNPPPDENAVDFVLSEFSREEKTFIEQSIALATEAVEVIIAEGIEVAMRKYNVIFSFR